METQGKVHHNMLVRKNPMQSNLYAMITVMSQCGHVQGLRECKGNILVCLVGGVVFAMFKITLYNCC